MSKIEEERGSPDDKPMAPLDRSFSEASTPPQSENALAVSWNQRGIYVRMSKRRKAALRRFAELSGNTETPHQALSACIEYADACARNPGHSSVGKTVPPWSEFDDAEPLVSKLDFLEASLSRIERSLGTGGRVCEKMLATAASMGNARELDEFGPDVMAAWLNALAKYQAEESELTLLSARWAWTAADRDSTALSVAFEMGIVDEAREQNSQPRRIQILTLPSDSPLLASIVINPKLEFVVACAGTSAGGQWLASFFPRRSNGELDEAVASIQV